jgi:hypothetical protein
MRKLITRMVAGLLLIVVALVPLSPATGQIPTLPAACGEFAFSTEEDFVTRGPEPPDGDPIISDGDLLGPNCVVCARNQDLVRDFDVNHDLGLDAVDLIDVEKYLVAFSTELDSPNVGQFTAGDLLVTNGVIIPNVALAYAFGVTADVGLDGLHFIGLPAGIGSFLDAVISEPLPRDYWLANPDKLADMLAQYSIDIWFSIEGTWAPPTGALPLLDGDLLSARTGTVVAGNDDLLPSTVPAGIPTRGVDFGLDGVTSGRSGERTEIVFSTELLYEDRVSFTDGDVLQWNDGVLVLHEDLVGCFEPAASFLGLDALHGVPEAFVRKLYLPLLLESFRQAAPAAEHPRE